MRSAIELDLAGWGEFFEEMGEPRYRAAQLCAWLWKRGVWDPAEMTDLSKALREKLTGEVAFDLPKIVKTERSKDGTKKFLVELAGGTLVECALIKQGGRLSACLSTQAGCPVGCPFCATGASGFERSLTRGEIASQFIAMERAAGKPVSSIVLMGMGEPLMNADAVFGAIAMLNDAKLRGLGIRHITLSTAGVAPGIRRMADEKVGVRLAVSLHAADDELRDRLVPCNSLYPLAELFDALSYYQRATGDRITIEYSLFKDVNDSVEHARKLVARLRGLHVYVNLIAGNDAPPYHTSPPENVLRFQSVLTSAGFESEIRAPRGRDINAACGQLRLKAAR